MYGLAGEDEEGERETRRDEMQGTLKKRRNEVKSREMNNVVAQLKLFIEIPIVAALCQDIS